MQQDLNLLIEWFEANDLFINRQKTKFMIFPKIFHKGSKVETYDDNLQ